MINRVLLFFLVCFGGSSFAQAPDMQLFTSDFVQGYGKLNIPAIEYSYRDYFAAIPSQEQLEKQRTFFLEKKKALLSFGRQQFKKEDKIIFDHLEYEINNNLDRIQLETEWLLNGRNTPNDGLSKLKNITSWYSLFIKRFTTVDISPEDVYAFGLAEVRRVKDSIAVIQKQLGYTDSAGFYKQLNSTSFFITDKQQLINAFEQIDKTVRAHLISFIGTDAVPPVYAMEWPGANAQTPPGMYLNHTDNAYSKDVFQFNFYNGRYNRRAMEWLYMHEAIPGHHMQFSLRSRKNDLQDLFFYPGNFEAWACYVEYFGKELGLYSDPYMCLGKWEWDLVRSARLVIDAGIHYYGWTREQALAYWKQNIPNQDDIAEREVTRVTNWPCQALSYKIGAMTIFKMQETWQKKNPGKPLSHFYRAFLAFGNLPLTVIEKNISIV